MFVDMVNTVLGMSARAGDVYYWLHTVIVVIAIAMIVLLRLPLLQLWIAAKTTKTPVSFRDLVGLIWGRIPPRIIVNPLIMATQANVPVTFEQLKSHYLAGGNVYKVVQAMIAAQCARLDLTLDQAFVIDLEGRDVLKMVTMCVEPHVLDCPNTESGKQSIDAVAKDGIQLHAIARVTVTVDLERFIAGAPEEEETIVALVGEGIVSAIGSANNHEEVLENPDMISEAVLAQGLDSGTSFKILCIDIGIVKGTHSEAG